MKVLAILGISLLVLASDPSIAASKKESSFDDISKQLSRYSRDPQQLETALKKLAGANLPTGLNGKQEQYVKAKRFELTATADAVSKLISELHVREKKARQQTLTVTDMENLEAYISQVARLSNQQLNLAASGRSMNSTLLAETIRETEIQQETSRNKRTLQETSFQNYEQRANQLYSQLSSLMKTANDMRMGVVRNLT
jgi:predicted extracellular nuclease